MQAWLPHISVGSGRTTEAPRNPEMGRSVCLHLLLLFLPFSFPNTLPLGTRHPRACCYWYAISEIQNNLTINSVSSWGPTGQGRGQLGSVSDQGSHGSVPLQESSDFNQRHILKVRAQAEGYGLLGVTVPCCWALPWAGVPWGQALLAGHT